MPWSVVPNDAESSRFVVERRGSALSDAGYPGEGPGITTESQGLERTHSGSVMRPPSCASRTVAKTGSERTVGSASWRAGDMSDILGLDHRPSAANPRALAYIAPGSVLPSLPLPSLLTYVTAPSHSWCNSWRPS